jgi:hypothetical protein
MKIGTINATCPNITHNKPVGNTFIKLPPKLQWDYRLGGVCRLLLSSDENFMFVPDEIRQCVIFIGAKSNVVREPKVGGTAFFVGILIGEDKYCTYVVTARHAIRDIQNESCDGKVYLRVNIRESGAQFIEVNLDQWRFHPTDEFVDVAIAPIQFSNYLEHKFLPNKEDIFVTPEVILNKRIGIGDEIFFTGLFRSHSGKQRNIPILRAGNIAAMPEEKVESRKWGYMDAYLVESRSISGLSGSPVFVYVNPLQGPSIRIGGIDDQRRGAEFHLLGLMHGHWDVTDYDCDSLVKDNYSKKDESINMGIAIVVPAEKILETLDHPDFQQQREIVRQGILVERHLSLPVEDVIARTESSSDMSDSFSVDTINIQPENKAPPMNP